MKRFIFIISLIIPYCLCAQISIDWQQCYGSMGNDEACGIIDNGNGYLLAGYVAEKNGMVSCESLWGKDWLIEITRNGDLVEEHCYDSIAIGEHGGIFKGKANGFYSVGVAPSEYGKNQINITRFDSDGNEMWRKSFGNRNSSFWLSPKGAATADGGVIANINTQWAGGDISSYYGMDDAWVVKVDSLGNLEWETTLGTEGLENAGGITLASDGGYYVSMCGRPGYNGSISVCMPPTTDEYDGFFVKLDGDGNVLWNRCYAGSKDDEIYQALELEDGFLLLCDTQSEDRDAEGAGYHFGYLNGQSWYRQTLDIWLIKTDFEGNIIWSKCYGGTADEFPLKAFQNEDGGFTVFGTTKSLDGDVVSTHNLQYNNEHMQSKIWVFRTDDQGNLIWERAIGTQKRAPETVADVIKHNDKEYTIAATAYPNHFEMTGDYYCSNDTIIPYSNENFWVLHITDIFNYDDPTGIEEQPKVVSLQMKVHPNPATTWVAVDYTLPTDNAKAELSVFNAMGVKVKQVELNGNQGQKVLDLRGLADGVYICTVLCGEYCQTQKIVITK